MRGRCSVMKFMVIMSAVFVVINIAFLFTQLAHNPAEDNNVCNCEKKMEVARPVISEEEKSVTVKPVTVKPEKVKPVDEIIRPAYNDRVKPKKFDNVSPQADSRTALPVEQGCFLNEPDPVAALPVKQDCVWNEPYRPLKHNSSSHKLAVVVPFRNRYEEMMAFVPHMHSFLTRQNVDHHIWVINQADTHRFNRASLLNIGFLLSRRECDYIVMHDIDLLPLNDDLPYKFPSNGPFHISSPELHPLYHYKTFVGGILIMSRDQFQKVDGLSNLFWGWGREDDELYVRMQEVKMKVYYPQGIRTGYKTFKHNHDREKRPRDQKKYQNQYELSRKRDRKTGVSTVQFRVVSNIEMTIGGAPLNFVNVELVCNYDITPFCDNPS